MLQPRQLLIPLILLLSCNSIDKRKEHGSVLYLKDGTNSTKPKRAETNPGTAGIIEKKPIASKIENTSKKVIVDSHSQSQTLLANDFERIEKGFQNFLIHSDLDTTLLCKEGTTLKIKQSSFLIASTLAAVKGTITFQVKEFYRLSDIIAARLTTYSNGNILETGGMLFTQATSNGQLCKLKVNSPIEISFPFNERKDSMLLFSGSWTNQKMNWVLFQPNGANQKEFIEELATFPGGTAALNNFISKNIVYPDSLADMGIGDVVQMDFVIDETGKAKNVNFKNRSHKGFEDAILNAF